MCLDHVQQEREDVYKQGFQDGFTQGFAGESD